MVKDRAFTIIKDTREKDGWLFLPEVKKANRFQCMGTKIECLHTGDYTIEGYADQILIERKAGFQELFQNMIPKENKARFLAEMDRMIDVPYKYLVIETNLVKDQWGMTLPQLKYGPYVSTICDWLIELQMKYNIVPIFAGDCSEKIVRKIFENFLRRHR